VAAINLRKGIWAHDPGVPKPKDDITGWDYVINQGLLGYMRLTKLCLIKRFTHSQM
jgi:hypothetical protein